MYKVRLFMILFMFFYDFYYKYFFIKLINILKTPVKKTLYYIEGCLPTTQATIWWGKVKVKTKTKANCRKEGSQCICHALFPHFFLLHKPLHPFFIPHVLSLSNLCYR